MEKLSLKEFGERVRQYVREALPHELKEAETCAARLDLGEGVTRTVLLVIRPWDGSATGFCLDDWHKKYMAGDATVESVVASIINDRRLYNTSIE